MEFTCIFEWWEVADLHDDPRVTIRWIKFLPDNPGSYEVRYYFEREG